MSVTVVRRDVGLTIEIPRVDLNVTGVSQDRFDFHELHGITGYESFMILIQLRGG